MKSCLPALLALMGLVAPCGAVTYSNWIAGYTVGDDSPWADPDGDGLANIVEYALEGFDPSMSDAVPALLPEMVYGTRATNSTIPWKDASVIVFTNAPVPPLTQYWHLGVRYTPRADTEGIRIRPQFAWWGSNLEAWLDGPACFLPPVAEGGDVIAWMLGMFRPQGLPGRSFVRLKVEGAP